MLEVEQLKKISILHLYEMRNTIDFEPTYQRKSNLWQSDMKQLFINTILNQYDFPKIYLANFITSNSPLNHKNKSYAVIDGK